jgi:hypothetical protein
MNLALQQSRGNSYITTKRFTIVSASLTSTRLEKILVVAAVVVSVFWPLKPLGINFGIADAALIFAMVSIIFRGWQYPFPSQRLTVSIIFFTTSAGISLLYTPLPLSGFLDFAQYLLIFFVVIPVGSVAFQSDQTRVWSLIGFLGVSHLLSLAILVEFVTGNFRPTLLYGNWNQPFWILAAATLVHLGFALDHGVETRIRVMSAAGAGYMSLYVILGPAESALFLLVVGVWLFALQWAYQNNQIFPFSIVTFI